MTSGARSTKKAPKAARVRGDGLCSYGAAMDVLGNSEKQEIGRWASNRVENSPLPLRRRERAMLRFRQMKPLQMFASVQASFKTTSPQTATSSTDKPISSSTWPHWPSGITYDLKTALPCPNPAERREVAIGLTAPHHQMPGPNI